MKNYLLYSAALLTFSACSSGKHHSSSGSSKQFSSHFHSHACNEKCYPGIAYDESCQAIELAIDPDVKYAMENCFAGKCRDLTDEEIDKINEEEDTKRENKKLKEILTNAKLISMQE